jgi:hypothetical protein
MSGQTVRTLRTDCPGARRRTHPLPLGGVRPAVRRVSSSEWEASALNRLFQEQGATGQAGRITATTTHQHFEVNA